MVVVLVTPVGTVTGVLGMRPKFVARHVLAKSCRSIPSDRLGDGVNATPELVFHVKHRHSISLRLDRTAGSP